MGATAFGLRDNKNANRPILSIRRDLEASVEE